MQLEDGEIEDDTSNDALDPYTPLERPDVEHVKPVTFEVQTDTEEKESSSDDSDEELLPKRPKMRRTTYPARKKKYSVWCKDPNEHLTDFLDGFGMRNPRNDRNVENYIVPRAFYSDGYKRKRPVRRNSSSLRNEDMEPLIIEELKICETNSFEEVAEDIAKKLSEPNFDLVLRIVIIIGKEKAIEFYNKTKEIEKDGGMLIANLSRRRTSGGIFILLVRNDKNISSGQKDEIFEDSKAQQEKRNKAAKRRYRKRKIKYWHDKLIEAEKGLESGQEELNNPPPSPEAHSPETLPPLPLRRDILYNDINLDSLNSIESQQCSVEVVPDSVIIEPSDITESPMKRDVVAYDDLNSMDLIYD